MIDFLYPAILGGLFVFAIWPRDYAKLKQWEAKQMRNAIRKARLKNGYRPCGFE